MEEAKPKRKYKRRAKVEPLAVYAVVVTVKRGRAVERIYGESARVENGCLVLVSMDGPPPLVEKVRYIPLGSAEIEVCRRPEPAMRWVQPAAMGNWAPPPNSVPLPGGGWGSVTDSPAAQVGPQISPGPLELLRQREAMQGGPRPVQRPPSQVVERNPDGIAVVTAGFLDGSPT